MKTHPAYTGSLQELEKSRWKRFWYNFSGLISILRGDVVHNTFGAYNVLRLWHVQKMKAGMVSKDHPWSTGVIPETGQTVWMNNVVFKTESLPGFEQDEVIMTKVGEFLADMVKKSAQLPEIPHGPDRRMPHVVNYLHGSVHYNGMWMLFNNFSEAKYYFSDPTFRKEFKRVVHKEKREISLVFRERKYSPLEYAYYSGFMMANIPWFANVNGPGKKVMWGNPSPYCAMNIINGNWVKDLDKLRKGKTDFIKSPVRSEYFLAEYGQQPDEYQLCEKLVAFVENEWVRRRGFNAGLFFIDRKQIDPKLYEKYIEDHTILDSKQTVVPNPLRKPT